ncbi:MAG: hypothetical protein IPK26_18545 [Planctomycetes bacterium]|nr:hypothetical protein [Planctomycetota bacterium]
MHNSILLTRCGQAIALTALAALVPAQWQAAAPANAPSARVDPQMTFFGATNQVLLFGGGPSFGSPFADTWTFNGSNWTQATPTTSPSGRAQAGIVYDGMRGVAVMYGGGNTSFFGGPSIDQTWEYDGVTWQQITTTNTPGGLAHMGIAHDIVRNRTVVYGGAPNSFFPIASDQTWEYDGFDWSLVTTANSPGPLERPAMCFHVNLGRTILFGGIDPQIGGNDTTWSFDGTNWTALNITGTRPSVRTGCKMVYDQARGVCVMYGGFDPMNGNHINETWEFDGAAWTQIASAPSPSRNGAGMAMDLARRQVVLFGGMDSNFNVNGETWIYGASYRTFGSGCAGSNGVPAIGSTSVPRIGSTFPVQIGNLAVGATVTVVAIGFSNTTSPLGALPLSLAPFGAPGCSALTSMDSISVIGAAGGNATFSLAIPAIPGLLGLEFHNQVGSVDAVNAANLTVSNGATGVIGH